MATSTSSGAKKPDGSAVGAAPLRLERGDGLHGAHLGGAAQRARREHRADRVEGVAIGPQAALHLRDDVHDVRVALDAVERGHVHAAGLGHPAHVVAGEVDEHGVLRQLLLVGEQVRLQRRVLDRVGRAGPGPGDGPRRDHAVAHTHEQLGRRAEHRATGPEVDGEQVRRRVDAPQRAVDLEGPDRAGQAEAPREHGLEHLAGVDVLDEAGHAGLVSGVGGRRLAAAPGPRDDDGGLVRAGHGQAVERLGQAGVRARPIDRRERRGLREVVEDDEHVGQVEERLGQADGVLAPGPAGAPSGRPPRRRGSPRPRPARRAGRPMGARVRQDRPQRLERVVGLETVELARSRGRARWPCPARR